MNTQAVRKTETACSQCSVRDICLPSGLDEAQLRQLDILVQHRRRVKRGEHLFRADDPLEYLYAIRSGSFKTYVLHEDGRERVTAFQIAGEILGMDAISNDAHTCHAVALEDSEVCVIPFTTLEQLSRELPTLQRHLHRLMSREIVCDHGVMLLLAAMRAEERLATLLLNLSRRYFARGYSASEFQLRMTREEIGNFLGLKLETVSRAFSKLHTDGLIAVHNKTVTLKNIPALRRLIGERERGHERYGNVYYVNF